jgi:hypothetical protein
MKKTDGFSALRMVLFASAASACLLWAFGQRLADLSLVAKPEDLRDELHRAQASLLPSGGDAVTYDAGDRAFAPAGDSAAMLSEGLVPSRDAAGNDVREVTLFEDALTRETVFFNAEGKEIGVLPPVPDYDPDWILKASWPDGAPEGIEACGYDPSLVVMTARLVSGVSGAARRAQESGTGGSGGPGSAVVPPPVSGAAGRADGAVFPSSVQAVGESSAVLSGGSSGTSTNAASAAVRPARSRARGVVYVDRASGRDAWTGLDSRAGGSDGPKRTVGAGLAAARKSGGRLVVRGGAYGESLNVRGLAVSVKAEGNVVLASAGAASDSSAGSALFAVSDASSASATGTVASVLE